MLYGREKINVDRMVETIKKLRRKGYYITMITTPDTYGLIKMVATQNESSNTKINRPLSEYLGDLTENVEQTLLFYADEVKFGKIRGNLHKKEGINTYWLENPETLEPRETCPVCGLKLHPVPRDAKNPTTWFCEDCDYSRFEESQQCPDCGSKLLYSPKKGEWLSSWFCLQCGKSYPEELKQRR